MIPIAPIKIIFTIFALFAWSRAVIKFRAKLMNAKEVAFWSFLWLSLIIAIFIPGKTTLLARLLGIERGFDAMIFIGIIGLFYAVYRLYVKSNEAERVMTEIVRKIALKHGIKKAKKKR
ncbi:hypothetical protein A2V71_03505 [Candidatus Berkelbacteria bacterium RBG_13_40_8]|uniref:DUF2304 domain-containing protein n=1 Tax=Candidatus Berkelbacteria bacterium RBG_13_40_8 TaxID=1797467 RepID=A0A1F5DNA8_9BACT|nr:MAG: hypothetical protein A2V71_03505 [Candidatus Berkelbacteria bacterium RBG_13_40_8]